MEIEKNEELKILQDLLENTQKKDEQYFNKFPLNKSAYINILNQCIDSIKNEIQKNMN